MVGHGASERGRLQRAAAFDEEWLAEASFEHGDGARNRGLGRAEQGGALGYAAGLDDSSQLHQMSFIELHSNLIY